MGLSHHMPRNLGKEQLFRILDSAFFIAVVLFLTFIVLHGKQISTYILCDENCNKEQLQLLESSYNNAIAWLGIFIMPFLLQYLRVADISLIEIGFWGSAVGVICCLAYFLFSSLKSPIIFFTQGFLYAVSIVVVGTGSFLDYDYKSTFWELVFSTISKLVGFIVVLYGAGSAILRYISKESGEAVDGYMSSFLYPTVIIVGVLFMLGYWVLIPVLEKIHEKNLIYFKRTHWWPSDSNYYEK